MSYKKYKILFLGKSNDIFSGKIINFLKKKKINLFVELSLDPKKKLKINKLKNRNFDFVFSFRSYFILNENFIKKIKYTCINFHPGPPEYRGIGCVNYAIFDKIKKYGLTAHIMNKKIDYGKIIDVRRFKILKKDNIESILKKTYRQQVGQIKNVVNTLLDDPNNIKTLIKKFSNEKWSSKIKTRKNLNEFYEIKKNMTKKNFLLKIKSTNTKFFKPYIKMYGKKFFYKL